MEIKISIPSAVEDDFDELTIVPNSLLSIDNMLPRRLSRLIYPKPQFMIKEKPSKSKLPGSAAERSGPKREIMQPPKQIRVKEGEGDPKLAGAILELVQGVIAISMSHI
jgi:hypothetical protein